MKIFFCFLLFITLSISFIPFYDSADKAGNQWLVLSLINLLLFSNLIFLKIKFNTLIFSKSFLFYLLFVFFAFISLSYSNNVILSLQDISRHITILFLIFLITNSFLYFKINFKIISWFFVFIILIESFASLSPLLFDFLDGNIDFFQYTSINIDALVGLTGNRNITTASIAIKLPFLFYLIFTSQNFLSKAFLYLVSFFPFLVLFIIGSRAALISFLITIFFLVCYEFYFLFKNKTYSKILKIIVLFIFIILSYLSSIHILPKSNSNTIDRLESINFSNESSSNRFILWENALDYISRHPFVGCGIGNWKIESSAYWGSLGENYLVPFHAHNDFLEFATELGLVGVFLYIMIFISAIYFLLSYFKQEPYVALTLFSCFTIYLVDANLNFPFERPVMQVPLALFISLVIYLQLTLRKKSI